MTWASIYMPAAPSSLVPRSWEVAQNLDLVVGAATFDPEVLIPKQPLSPMMAMNHTEHGMGLALEEELSRLYEIANGTASYVKYSVAQ